MLKKLYIAPHEKFSPKSVKELIDSLFKEQTSHTRRKYARPTYKDKNCTKLECNAGRRSFEDMLILARTRFPNTSEKCLMQALKDLKIKFYFCYSIRKAIFHFVGGSYGYTLNENNFYRLPQDNLFIKGTYTQTDLSNIYNQL